MKIGIVGFGTWGQALNTVLEHNNVETKIWEYRKTIENSTTNLEELRDCQYLVIVVPFFSFEETIKSIASKIGTDVNIIIATKGIDEKTNKFTSEIAESILPDSNVAVLSGPTHAEEVMKKMVTTIVASSKNVKYMEEIQKIFNNNFFRVYTNKDTVGVELGAAVKNILAIAAGIIDGLGHGDNAKAAMITRSMKEIVKLGISIGAKEETLYGLTGLGDLVVTSISKHSRNRQFGEYLGQGLSKDDAEKKVGMVVEGIYSLNAVHKLAEKNNLDLVIINAVYDIVEKNHNAQEILNKIMEREYKDE